eukprot:COSAG02_NODE_20_length_53673_cov_86.864841_47_plen_56_part_00
MNSDTRILDLHSTSIVVVLCNSTPGVTTIHSMNGSSTTRSSRSTLKHIRVMYDVQ